MVFKLTSAVARIATEKSCAAVTSAFSLSPANTDVAKAKKAILQKKRTIGPDSTQRAVSRQSIGVSAPSAKPTRAAVPLPDFVEPMKATLVDSIPPGSWIYEIKLDGYRAFALRGG